MNNEAWWRANDRTKYVEDRKIDQLIGLADGILADGIVNQQEAERLKAWLELNGAESNPLMARLLDQVESALADGVLDEDEALALHDALMEWTGGEVEEGEVAKTAALPLDPEPRAVVIPGKSFVFTGTGVFGTRKMMQEATERTGGMVMKSVTLKTDYVVLGTYVTPAWAHQSFGRKIEKAMEYRDTRTTELKIVHEEDWARAIEHEA